MHNYRMAVTEREVLPNPLWKQRYIYLVSRNLSSGEEWVHHNARRLCQRPCHHLHKDPQVAVISRRMVHNVEVHLFLQMNNKLGDCERSVDFQSTVDRNINLQNLKRASAFIDIMDRHLDTVCQQLSLILCFAWLMLICCQYPHSRKPKTSWATTGTSWPRTRWSQTREYTRGACGF